MRHYEDDTYDYYDDEFEIKAARARRKGSPQAQTVFAREPANGPWSGSENYGRLVEPYKLEVLSDTKIPILQIAEFGAPKVRTVTLGWRNDPNSSYYRLIGGISGGVGGATQEFEVDWKQGISFSFLFNAIQVTAQLLDNKPGGFGPTIAEEMGLVVSIGDGTVINRPTRSYYAEVTAGGSSGVQIPPFANKLKILNYGTGDPYASGHTITFNDGGYTIGTYPSSIDLCVQNGIPIPMGGRNVVFNNTGGTDLDILFEFELSL